MSYALSTLFFYDSIHYFFGSLHTALSFKFRVENSNPYPFRDEIGKSTIVVFQVFLYCSHHLTVCFFDAKNAGVW